MTDEREGKKKKRKENRVTREVWMWRSEGVRRERWDGWEGEQGRGRERRGGSGRRRSDKYMECGGVIYGMWMRGASENTNLMKYRPLKKIRLVAKGQHHRHARLSYSSPPVFFHFLTTNTAGKHHYFTTPTIRINKSDYWGGGDSFRGRKSANTRGWSTYDNRVPLGNMQGRDRNAWTRICTKVLHVRGESEEIYRFQSL